MGIELNYLDPKSVRIWMPKAGSSPRVEIDGDRCVLSARIRRAFPLTNPDQFYSILDSAGKEAGLLRGTEGLSKESLKALNEELDRRYFSPVITRIDILKADAGMWYFEVQTQRGPATFYVRNWRDSAFDIGGDRWQIHSVDGLRYEILKLGELDERSQSLLDQVF